MGLTYEQILKTGFIFCAQWRFCLLINRLLWEIIQVIFDSKNNLDFALPS